MGFHGFHRGLTRDIPPSPGGRTALRGGLRAARRISSQRGGDDFGHWATGPPPSHRGTAWTGRLMRFGDDFVVICPLGN